MTIATNTVGMTKKQRDMSTARSPKNFNQQNEVKEPQEGFKRGLKDFTQQQQQWQPVIDPHEDSGAAKPRDTTTEGQVDRERNEPLRAAVAENIKNLGTFGLQVQAKINGFVNKGRGLVGATGHTFAEWKEDTGSWGLGDTVQEDVSNLVGAKQVEQEGIDDVLSEWYDTEGGREAMSFREGLEREAGKLAERYPDIVKRQDYLLGLADRLHLLEDEGLGNSAEARALRQSIRTEDDQGLVQLLYDANKEYRRNVYGEKGGGMSWSGDGFTEFTAHDFATLTAEELENEIQNTAIGSLGIFSGDYAVNLKRQLDEMREEYLKSGQEEVRRQEEYTRLAEQYLDEWGDEMGTNAEEIQAAFQNAIADLEERILNTAAPGGPLAEIQKRIDALEAEKREKSESGHGAPDESALAKLQERIDELEVEKRKQSETEYNIDREEERGELARAYLATLGGGDFSKGMEKYLNDPNNGLQARQRELLREFIGSDKGRDGDKGELNAWMQQLATGQPISYRGNKLKLNADEKAQVIRAAYAQDEEHIEKVFENNMRRIDVDLPGLLEQTKQSESLGDALEVWKDSLHNSVSNFIYSKTEDAMKAGFGIDDERWAAMETDEKTAAMAEYVQRNSYQAFDQLLQGSAAKIDDDFKSQLEERRQAIEANRRNAQMLIEQAERARENLKKEHEKAVQAAQRASNVKPGFDGKLADEYLKRLGAGSKEGLHNPLLEMQAEAERGHWDYDIPQKVAQGAAVLSQIRALRGNQIGSELADEAVKRITSEFPEMQRAESDGIVTGLPPMEMGRLQNNKRVVDHLQQVWNETASAYNKRVNDQINDDKNRVNSAYRNMTGIINTDITKARGMLSAAAREEQTIAKVEREIAQGVFTPQQIMNLGLQQAKRIEQAGSEALESMLRSYPRIDPDATVGDSSAYYDLGGYEGRQTINEVQRDLNAIMRREAMSGAAGINPGDLGGLVEGVTPLGGPSVNMDWVVDKRPPSKPVQPARPSQKDTSKPPVDASTGREFNMITDPREVEALAPQVKSWTQSGVAQSGYSELPDGTRVHGYFWRDSNGNPQFMPDLDAMKATGFERLGMEAAQTVALLPDWAKNLVSVIPGVREKVRNAETLRTVQTENMKKAAELNRAMAGAGDNSVSSNLGDFMNMSPANQLQTINAMEKQAREQIIHMSGRLGVRPPDIGNISTEGLARLTDEYRRRLEHKDAQEAREREKARVDEAARRAEEAASRADEAARRADEASRAQERPDAVTIHPSAGQSIMQ